MSDGREPSPGELVRPLVRVRQIREFTPEPPGDTELDALADAGRWSGSSMNGQPWRFIVIRDREVLLPIQVAGLPQTRCLETAPAAIVIVLPDDAHAISHAYDDGRAAERIIIAANLLGLTGGIAWIRADVRSIVSELLGLPADRFVRTIVVVGHPTEAALAPKSKPGQGRLPRAAVVFQERWPVGRA